MEHGTKLDDWLAAARSDLAQRGPDLLAEQQLLARAREVRALQSVAATRAAQTHQRAKRAPFWSWRPAAFAGVAAVVVAIGVAALTHVVPRNEATARTPFLALVASEAIAAEPSAVVVSSQVAAATLHDYGLPVDPARADQPVRAEFLVSPAGLVLAVRFAE